MRQVLKLENLLSKLCLEILEAKEKMRAFFWAAHQLARKMNLMQMAELTKSCPNLTGVFDLAAMVRMRNRPLSVSIGKIKENYEGNQFSSSSRESRGKKGKTKLEQEGEIIRKNFESELKIIYAATLLTGESIRSSPIYRIIPGV